MNTKLLLFFVLVSLLSACGGGNEPDSADKTTQPVNCAITPVPCQ
jgi:hypothetical protein